MDCSEVSHLLFTKNRLQQLKLSALHFILTAAECQRAEGLRGCREKRGVSHPETQATLVGAQSRESSGARRGERGLTGDLELGLAQVGGPRAGCARARGCKGRGPTGHPGARSCTGWGAQREASGTVGRKKCLQSREHGRAGAAHVV